MQEAYIKYLTEGGMPGSYVYKSEKDKHKYIRDIFDTLVLRDIKQKYKIRNESVLTKTTDFLIDNISNLTTARKLTEAINNKGDKVDHKTVDKYINYLCKAFAFYKVRRYDIQGKKYLARHEALSLYLMPFGGSDKVSCKPLQNRADWSECHSINKVR